MYIKYNFHIAPESKEQISELHIHNASLKDAGVYQCFASNSYGSAHSGKANVSVVGESLISLQIISASLFLKLSLIKYVSVFLQFFPNLLKYPKICK